MTVTNTAFPRLNPLEQAPPLYPVIASPNSPPPHRFYAPENILQMFY